MTAKMEMFDNNAQISMSEMRTFASLPKEAWEYIDDMLIRVAKNTLVGIRDLNSRPNLVKNFNGMSAQVYTINRVSEMGDAKMAVAPDTRGENGALDFDTISVPMAVTYKDFVMNTKQVSMAARAGIPFDTTAMEEAVRSVSRTLEHTLFNGGFSASGHKIYGYITFPDALVDPMTAVSKVVPTHNWLTAAPEDILDDVNTMVDKAFQANHEGPFILYVPREYNKVLNEDYIHSGTVLNSIAPSYTIRQRLSQLQGLEAVTATRDLPFTVATGHSIIVLVEMQNNTVELINGLPLTVGDWEPTGTKNWNHHFKALAMSVPFLKSDYKGQTGIVIGTNA